jgi:hypothetical protein
VSGPRGYPAPRPDGHGRIAGHITLVNGERLAVTIHCVDRFWERAAVGSTLFRHAFFRLQRLASEIGSEGPWLSWARTTDPPPGQRWIALGPDVGLVVVKRTAVTCLARGSRGHTRHRKRRDTERRGSAN